MRWAGAETKAFRRGHPREVLLLGLFALWPLSGVVRGWDTIVANPLLLASGVALVALAVLVLTAPTRV